MLPQQLCTLDTTPPTRHLPLPSATLKLCLLHNVRPLPCAAQLVQTRLHHGSSDDRAHGQVLFCSTSRSGTGICTEQLEQIGRLQTQQRTLADDRLGLGAGSGLRKEGLKRGQLLLGQVHRRHACPDGVRPPWHLVPEERPQLHRRLPQRAHRLRSLFQACEPSKCLLCRKARVSQVLEGLLCIEMQQVQIISRRSGM